MDFLQSEEEKDTKTKFDAQDVLQSDEAVAPVETDGSTSALFDLCLRAAKSLNVTWPAPPPRQQQTRLAGSYFLPKQQAAVRHKMPVFPDFLTELTRSWSTPKAPLSLPLSQFLDVEGMEQAGLSHMPPMDETLAAHLAPPSKHCRFSALQLEKIYRAQCHAARALNTASMLQAYQAERLQDLQESAAPKGKITESVEEARRTADLVLRLTGTAAVALGKSMAEAVVAQRHLWLTLTELPESQRAAFLHQAVEPTGLFGGAPLEKIQNLCDLRCKQETSKLEKQSSMPESDYDNTFHDSETDDLGTGRLKSSSWLGEGSSVPELDDVEMESDPTLPSTEDVIRKTEQITKNIQELLRAAQDNKRDSFIPCSERIQVAVTEMAALFPKKPRSETVRNSLHLLTFSASRLQNECRKAVPSEVGSSGPDMQLVTQQVIQCAFDIAKAAKQLVTITTKENAN